MRLYLIEPASPLKENRLGEIISAFRQQGYEVDPPQGKKPYYFCAGTPEERWQEFSQTWQKQAGVILPLRGGVGSLDLLDKLKELPPAEHIFTGGSDLTFLLNSCALRKLCRCALGPMGEHLAITGKAIEWTYFHKLTQGESFVYASLPTLEVLKEGEGEGILLGGTLMCFLEWLSLEEPLFQDPLILFLEEVDEPGYRLYRLLQLLKKQKIWQGVQGIIFGQWTRCQWEENQRIAFLKEYFRSFKGPVVMEFPGGHGKTQLPLWLLGWTKISTSPLHITSHPPKDNPTFSKSMFSFGG